jgi:hypothetical protein
MSGFGPPPTQAGFNAWVYTALGLTTAELPTTSVWLTYAYTVAADIVNPFINRISPLQYTLAVYNFAADRLVNFAQDTPPGTFFTTMRAQMDIADFVPGVVSATADESTSTSILNTEAMKTLTLANLQSLKTPWGRIYLGIAQDTGTIWGVS